MRMVVVELVVVHDGVTDLPSAGEHMKKCIDDERCRIPVKGGGSLKPAPRSMKVKHKFAASITTTASPSYHELGMIVVLPFSMRLFGVKMEPVGYKIALYGGFLSTPRQFRGEKPFQQATVNSDNVGHFCFSCSVCDHKNRPK